MTACLLAGTQFFLVLGSIWKTCARVVNMGCSLQDERWARELMARDFLYNVLFISHLLFPKILIAYKERYICMRTIKISKGKRGERHQRSSYGNLTP